MAGFTRRFTVFPALDVITEIEGVIIVDLIPPGIFVGRTTGTICLVGEWPAGPTNTPTIVEGDQTIEAFGGFSLSLTDPFSYTTPNFLNPYSNGNAFCWLKGKTYRKLVVVRVDNSLALGAKVQLTDVSLASVAGSKTITAGSPATLEDLNAPGGGFRQEMVGRTITIASAPTAANNGAFPIVAVLSPTRLQYTNGAAVTETSALTTWTITPGTLGADVTVPAGTRVYDASATDREFALAQDVVFAAGTDLATSAFTAFDPDDLDFKYTTRTVSVVPVYSTKNTSEGAVSDVDTVNIEDLFRADLGAGSSRPWAFVDSTTGALDGAAANAAALAVLTASQYDTRYENAIDATLPGDPNVDNVEVIAAARQSQTIRTKLRENARDASSTGTGRMALVRPPIGTLPASAQGASDPGVGANRSDRVIYCYPHFEQRISQLAELDPEGVIVPSANILNGADSAASTILSQLAPEFNPGQSTQGIVSGGILSFVRKLEDELTGAGQPTAFTMQNYINFKSAGIMALRRDPQIGEWIFQSGVTAVDPDAFPQLAPVKRRRMADFLQDSMVTISKRFVKLLRTTENIDSLVGEITDFLDTMLSSANPAQQRIAAYAIDATSGNTSILQGAGIFVLVIDVQLLDDFRHIVLQTQIGETVEVAVQE